MTIKFNKEEEIEISELLKLAIWSKSPEDIEYNEEQLILAILEFIPEEKEQYNVLIINFECKGGYEATNYLKVTRKNTADSFNKQGCVYTIRYEHCGENSIMRDIVWSTERPNDKILHFMARKEAMIALGITEEGKTEFFNHMIITPNNGVVIDGFDYCLKFDENWEETSWSCDTEDSFKHAFGNYD